MLTTNEKIERLRARMKERDIYASYIGTADPHDSEYIAPHYQARAWLTGFSGSAGTAIVTQERALLWADGRYHIQAEKEITGTCFELMKQGAPHVPSVEQWLEQSLPKSTRLSIDGKLFPDAHAKRLMDLLRPRSIELITDLDLVGSIWDDRPALPTGKIFLHDIRYTGREASDKINEVRRKMATDGADYALYVGLDDIAWLMNFRGSDVPNNVVAMAFAFISAQEAILFIELPKVDTAIKAAFTKQGIALRAYDTVGDYLGQLPDGVLVADTNRVSHSLINALPKGVRLRQARDYPYLMKTVLNETELLSQYRAGVRDSVAVARFLYYIKHEAAGRGLNEFELTDKLRRLRQESDQFIIESFPTISAYGPNAAMMHYQATRDQHSDLQPRGFYLVDCGAQAYDGTTDITRTCSLGPLTQEEKLDYTMTLKSHIALASLPFLDGASGTTLDAVARSTMWRYGLDYKCGTGHGFGYLSGVHEGPQRLTHNPRLGDYGFRENIVITIEPGVYREGKHGIRLENDYVVLRANMQILSRDGHFTLYETPHTPNESGDVFLRFQAMTFVPFDRDAIMVDKLREEEIDWLNHYNESVRQEIVPYLTGDELAFVLKETEPF
ncbi:MAG TPA: aminopeptidase P family N-terminal domain-containing protein [Clostridia bacterium]|nr:aminopeptidase P family N-terminal domain-containing protein [Clostridia bacterium]